MKILFDHNIPRRFRRFTGEHVIQTTREMRWEEFGNGVLLEAAAGAAFDAILCIDKKIEYEQNLTSLPLPVIVLDAYTNALEGRIPFAPHFLKLLDSPLEKALYVIKKDGDIARITAPRPKS